MIKSISQCFLELCWIHQPTTNSSSSFASAAPSFIILIVNFDATQTIFMLHLNSDCFEEFIGTIDFQVACCPHLLQATTIVVYWSTFASITPCHYHLFDFYLFSTNTINKHLASLLWLPFFRVTLRSSHQFPYNFCASTPSSQRLSYGILITSSYLNQ